MSHFTDNNDLKQNIASTFTTIDEDGSLSIYMYTHTLLTKTGLSLYTCIHTHY